MVLRRRGPGPGPFRAMNCLKCGGPLRLTNARGRPQQEDHVGGCESFRLAVPVILYADELKQAAAGPNERRISRGDKKRREYLTKSAKELTTASCSANVSVALNSLLYQYKIKYFKNGQLAPTAQMLMEACSALAQGIAPAPVITASS